MKDYSKFTMGIFTTNPEAIRPSSYNAFIDNIIHEGTREVVVRGTFKEKFVDVVDPFILLATGKRITTPVRAANMRFYRIGAQFETLSITGLPIVYNEDYDTINKFESGYVAPNLDDAAIKTFLTMEDRIGQLQSRIPEIKINLIDGGNQVTRELMDEIREYAKARALDSYGKPVQLSFRYA